MLLRAGAGGTRQRSASARSRPVRAFFRWHRTAGHTSAARQTERTSAARRDLR